MPRISRFKRRESDRSGFRQWEIELVKDGPWKVAGDEMDQPPPSRQSLGGEGDRSPGEPLADSGFELGVGATTASYANTNQTVYITAAGGITPSFRFPWMLVTGSNGAVDVSATPNIVRGRQGNILTLQCVDSSITLNHGSANAINFMDSRGSLTLSSGMVVTFFYATGNLAWNETSRFRP